jgi:hypothetical protein
VRRTPAPASARTATTLPPRRVVDQRRDRSASGSPVRRCRRPTTGRAGERPNRWRAQRRRLLRGTAARLRSTPVSAARCRPGPAAAAAKRGRTDRHHVAPPSATVRVIHSSNTAVRAITPDAIMRAFTVRASARPRSPASRPAYGSSNNGSRLRLSRARCAAVTNAVSDTSRHTAPTPRIFPRELPKVGPTNLPQSAGEYRSESHDPAA